MKKNKGFVRQSFPRSFGGFGALEAFLVLVIVGILGFTGWYVYNARNKTNNTYNTTDQSANSTASYKKKTTATDPTANWVAYLSKDGQYSLKYPNTWAKALNPELCTPGLLLLGGDKNSVGKCGADGPGAFGQISISSVDYTGQKDYGWGSGGGYKDATDTSVTTDNVKGTKTTMTVDNSTNGPNEQGYKDGVKVTQYQFITKNKVYLITYVQQSTYPDVLNDFNTMVTKTLKFSS